MLRIEEIVGAMDDEFRYALDALDSDHLKTLSEDKAALRRMRPVGVSNAEAVAMIAAILKRRAAPPPPRPQDPRRRARKPPPPRPEQTASPPPPEQTAPPQATATATGPAHCPDTPPDAIPMPKAPPRQSIWSVWPIWPLVVMALAVLATTLILL